MPRCSENKGHSTPRMSYTPDNNSTLEPAMRYKAYRRLALLLLFALAAAVVWGLWSQSMLTARGVLEIVAQHSVLAPILFIGVYAMAALFLIPTLPLNIGAGFIWGPMAGALYSLLGSTLGGCCAFLFARTTFGQPLARSFQIRLLKKVMSAVATGGWKVVAFARLNPVVPTGVVNFLFGLTALDFWTFLWASLAFAIPMCLAFSYLGFSTGSLILEGDVAHLLRVVGVAMVIGLLFFAGRHLMPNGTDKGKPPSAEA